MNIKQRIQWITLLGVSSFFCIAVQAQSFSWPGGAKAAVNLAYDDAMPSQLDSAIPALNKYGLHGSFYLSLASDTVATRMDEWRAAAKAGHELGNHSLFHHCSKAKPGRDWVKPYHDLDTLSMEHMVEQITLANVMLKALDGKTERTFTSPCIDTEIAGKDYLQAIRHLFIAIKAEVGGVTSHMSTVDPYRVGVDLPSDVTGEQLINKVKEAGKKGTMVNFTFHGIGGDYLTVSNEAHEQLLKFLSENRETYWTSTFINIMKHVKQTNADSMTEQCPSCVPAQLE